MAWLSVKAQGQLNLFSIQKRVNFGPTQTERQEMFVSLIMGTKMVPERSAIFKQPTRLMARDFINSVNTSKKIGQYLPTLLTPAPSQGDERSRFRYDSIYWGVDTYEK
jgi:hypothetical protein